MNDRVMAQHNIPLTFEAGGLAHAYAHV